MKQVLPSDPFPSFPNALIFNYHSSILSLYIRPRLSLNHTNSKPNTLQYSGPYNALILLSSSKPNITNYLQSFLSSCGICVTLFPSTIVQAAPPRWFPEFQLIQLKYKIGGSEKGYYQEIDHQLLAL